MRFDPMATFQGSPLDHESAWKIMEGHWIESPCSWRPVLGQNPAYDYFPSQYNSWYRDPKGNRGWYDPVFKVITLDGREVWRKRHLAPVHPSRTVQMDWFQEVSSDPGGRFELDQAGYVGCLADFPSSKSFLHISILSVVQGMCQLG